MLVETIYRNLRNQLLLRFGLDLVKVADRKTFLQPIRRVMSETSVLLNGCEAYFLMSCAAATANVEGDIAEVGVFRGGSAKLIAEAKGDRELHLFDSFTGLPELTEKDSASLFQPGQFLAMEDEVRRYLSSFANVFIHKGWFPGTARSVGSRKFSFVHLDVDLFEPTRDALEFFYPRLSRGAVLVSHDYNYAAGVRRAFDEFFLDKPENVLEQPGGTQCFIVKQ
jgi:hypothetical protein